MKCVKIDLPSDLQMITIEIFADLHLGSKKCDYKLIQDMVERVKNNENTYAILLGDMINNSTKDSVGDVYEEELAPMDQIKLAIRTFEPIKEKILGIVTGNHERRSYKKEGVDLLYFLASEFKITDRYDYCADLLFIRFGINNRLAKSRKNRKMCYTVYMTHGDGQGGRTIGGKANGLQRRGQVVNADVIVTGHTHMPFTFRDISYAIDYQNSCAIEREQVFVNASATLNYEEYAELFGMKPSSKVSPKIILNGTKREVAVMM